MHCQAGLHRICVDNERASKRQHPPTSKAKDARKLAQNVWDKHCRHTISWRRRMALPSCPTREQTEMAALYVSRLGLAELGALQEARSRCTILVKSMVWPYACTHSHPSAERTSSFEGPCCMCHNHDAANRCMNKISTSADA